VKSTRRTILIGGYCMIGGCALVFLPLLLGRWPFNRFIVLIGLIGVLIGASIAAHGALDLLRRH
jgi:hypothetical protein